MREWQGERRGAADGGEHGSLASRRAHRLAAGLAERMGRTLVPIYAAARPTDDMPMQTDVGDPVEVLRSRALDADARLIVVGSRGRGPLRGALLGSVSAALAASAPAPVLVVPRTAELTGLAGEDVAGLPAAA